MGQLHYFPANANAAPHMLLEEFGAKYELLLVDWIKGAQKSKETAASLARIPDGERVSIDIDRFDPSIAPGTATISHGGFSYYEGKAILREVAKRFDVAGVDIVEVSPPYDPSGITSLLAARTSLDFIGSIFHERGKRRR
jgi:agmatinase